MCENQDIDWDVVVELAEEGKTSEACTLALIAVNLLESDFQDRFRTITGRLPVDIKIQQPKEVDFGNPEIDPSGRKVKKNSMLETEKLTVLVGLALNLNEKEVAYRLLGLLQAEAKNDGFITPLKF